ncbi:MAG: hypothetical protein JKY56_10990 [Kofleriaceae bacterium]|nr:hypothetical protein [Kofleriaceae bacterium]
MKRRWPWWMLWGLLLSGLVLSVLAYRGYFEHKNGFSRESGAILIALTGGPESAGEVYEAASFSLQETGGVDSFVDRADRITKTLGTFQGIEDVEKIETTGSIRGKTVRVEYTLRFELATTWAEFSYLRNKEKQWQLLGFEIMIPEELQDKGAEIDSEAERLKAPKEVTILVEEMLVDISEGRSESVHARSAKPFRESKTSESFSKLTSRFVNELGSFQNIIKTFETGQNQDKDRAHLVLLLQFEKAKTKGSFKFIKRAEKWLLLYFKVEIPEPLLPAR